MIYKIIDVWAVLALVSLLLYAFAGITVWAPLHQDVPSDLMRAIFLSLAHLLPPLIVAIRRAG